MKNVLLQTFLKGCPYMTSAGSETQLEWSCMDVKIQQQTETKALVQAPP